MFRALELRSSACFPAPSPASMSSGATDMAQLRAKGVPGLGFARSVDEHDRMARTATTSALETSLPKLVEFLCTPFWKWPPLTKALNTSVSKLLQNPYKDTNELNYAWIFLLIAIAAAALGFGGWL